MKLKLLKTFAWFLFGFCLGIGIMRKMKPEPILTPLAEVTPTATPTPTPEMNWSEAIRAIFPEESAGMMIRICLLEHKGTYGQYAIRNEDNGSYSYGWCQINSVHRPPNMSDFEWQAYLENPMNHAIEVLNVYRSQGFEAWIASYSAVRSGK